MSNLLRLLPLLLPLTLLTINAHGGETINFDDSEDGYFDEAPVIMPGAVPGQVESLCDAYLRMYDPKKACELGMTPDHTKARGKAFSGPNAAAPAKAYKEVEGKVESVAKAKNGGMVSTAQSSLEISMQNAQYHQAVAVLCQRADEACRKTWCPQETDKCKPMSNGYKIFNEAAKGFLSNAFKSAETVEQSKASAENP